MTDKNIEKIAICICMAVIAIFLLGTAAIPLFIARSHGWAWLLLYPAILFIAGFVSRKHKRK